MGADIDSINHVGLVDRLRERGMAFERAGARVIVPASAAFGAAVAFTAA